MRFKDDNDNRYRVNFTRATEAHIDKMTVAEFIEYLENNAEFEDESTPIYIDGKTIWCKDCVLKETYKLRKEFLVSEDGSRLFYGLAGKPEYTLLGRPVNVCDYLPSFANAENNSIVGFLFNFKDYVLNTNYAMGVKKYEDNDTDDMVTKGIMLADGKVVDTGSYVPLKKVQAV